MTDDVAAAAPFRHLALFYSGSQEYLDGVLPFVRAGLDRGEPSLAAVPAPRLGLLREALAADSARVCFADMTELGRNPARIIPAVTDFIRQHPGKRISYLGEPAWQGRTAPELCEATRHEALINLAFRGVSATILCPYDVSGLPRQVVADARRTHPALLTGGQRRPSAQYLGESAFPAACDRALAAPPSRAATLIYGPNLAAVRQFVTQRAERAGLPEERTADLVLAVSELAANTLNHTAAGGTVRFWQARNEVLCQVDDRGWITDPLAGRRLPPLEGQGGMGLWVVNQLCDLVELRTGEHGTSIRLHMRLPAG
jgi:anti-sigma regulatory factor (Ser/Thr protein kinase)